MTHPLSGFLSSTGSVASVGTSYAAGKVVTLDAVDFHAGESPKGRKTAGTLSDSAARFPPGSFRFSHIEIKVTQGSMTALDCFISTDAAGDDPITQEASVSIAGGGIVVGITTTSIAKAVIPADLFYTYPLDAPAKTDRKLYLHCKGDATFTINWAKLHWVKVEGA